MSPDEIKFGFRKDAIKVLATVGWKAAYSAYKAKTFKNRTFNLHDSYGSAVYVNGTLIEDSIKYANRSRSKKRSTRNTHLGATGREALDRYFRRNHFGGKNTEIVLVVVAAMWYADILQKKGYMVIKGVAYQTIAKEIDNAMLPVFKKWGIQPYSMSRAIGIGQDLDYYHGVKGK